MKKQTLRKAFALILALAMLCSVFCFPASAETAPVADSGDDYTTVLVHGLLGWGDEDGLSDLISIWGLTSGNMPDYLRDLGYDVYVASIGPISSAHDRCCELYAQLTGARVDYGQAHADKCTAEYASLGYSLTHDRYGRDYTGDPHVENWGPIYENGKVVGFYDNKINLVGHSFGGPTALEFLDLLANGDADEIAWAKEQQALYGGDWHDYISPLFWGDYHGEYLIHSVTSLAGVLNGTTFITANDDAMDLMTALLMLIANATGSTFIADIYDFQLEQFGLTAIPGSDVKAKFSFLAQKGYIAGSDHAFYDLTTHGTNELKHGWETYPNVYYFSYSCDKSYKAGGAYMPDPDMLFLLIPFSMVMGSYKDPNELVYNLDGTVYSGIDAEWMPNDGMVNTVTSRYPLGAPHRSYNVNDIASGVWNVHPDIDKDHFGIVGSFLSPDPIGTRKLFRGVLEDISRTTPIRDEHPVVIGAMANALDAPVIKKASRTLLTKKPSLDWKAVSGAASYQIYRATSENGTYSLIGTTVLTSYTDFSAPAGTCFYKLVAVPLSRSKSASPFSAAFSV